MPEQNDNQRNPASPEMTHALGRQSAIQAMFRKGEENFGAPDRERGVVSQGEIDLMFEDLKRVSKLLGELQDMIADKPWLDNFIKIQLQVPNFSSVSGGEYSSEQKNQIVKILNGDI